MAGIRVELQIYGRNNRVDIFLLSIDGRDFLLNSGKYRPFPIYPPQKKTYKETHTKKSPKMYVHRETSSARYNFASIQQQRKVKRR